MAALDAQHWRALPRDRSGLDLGSPCSGGVFANALLLAGLEKLEYRGYDSAGISVLDGDRIDAVRAVGNLSALRGAIQACGGDHAPTGRGVALAERERPGTGIGHTRWATHGRVTQENAHPHFDTTDRVHIVVNGIVENYIALKARLAAEGAVFTSETDAEVIAHLVADHYDGDLSTRCAAPTPSCAATTRSWR